MPTVADLKDYLTTDPDTLGIAALWSLHDDSVIAALLNDLTKGGPVPYESLSRGTLLMALAGPAIAILPGKPADVQQRWALVIQMLQAADLSIWMLNPDKSATPARGIMDQTVIDGLLTSQQETAISTRPGSPAESRWGVGTVIRPEDVSAAVPDSVAVDRAAAALALANQWKVDRIAEFLALAHELIADAIDGHIGIAVGNQFFPAADPFSVSIQTAWDNKGAPLDDTELGQLAAVEMMRTGGGRA